MNARSLSEYSKYKTMILLKNTIQMQVNFQMLIDILKTCLSLIYLSYVVLYTMRDLRFEQSNFA